MKSPKTLLVSAIKNGTVIDHIKAGNALKIIRILSLPAEEKLVTVGLNLPSKATGKKDLIKVEGRELTNTEANHVAILAPMATINIIRNYKVIKKFTVNIPKEIDNLIICPNPQCITNHEKMKTNFTIINNGKQIKIKCKYCEKGFSQNEIREYNT